MGFNDLKKLKEREYIPYLILALYLMVRALYAMGPPKDHPYHLWIRIALFVFEVLFILYTVGTLIGKRSEMISDKVKIFRADAIIFFLLFTKAAYELADDGLHGTNVDILSSIIGFYVFIPLLIIAALYGMFRYGKTKKERKIKKKSPKLLQSNFFFIFEQFYNIKFT